MQLDSGRLLPRKVRTAKLPFCGDVRHGQDSPVYIGDFDEAACRADATGAGVHHCHTQMVRSGLFHFMLQLVDKTLLPGLFGGFLFHSNRVRSLGGAAGWDSPSRYGEKLQLGGAIAGGIGGPKRLVGTQTVVSLLVDNLPE
jgi:hypothetical protein